MIWHVETLLLRSQIVSQRCTKIGNTLFNCDTLSISYNDEIWGVDSDADSHTLDVHISRLHERFKNNHDFEIVTVRGLGYKVVKKDE